jgi:DegV family protein with EDD domain
MPKIAIVTDSSACLPAELIRAHQITIVPLAFLFDGDPHLDGSLNSRDFYALLRASRRFPTTASPAPAAFVEAFRQAAQTAEAALCITLPSTFSGTYSSALTAIDLAREELPGFPIHVVDSHCLAMCHGFAVLAAARAAEKGASMDAAEEAVRDAATRSYLIGALDTLRYLAKSGRVPMVVHWATSLLQIKPILAATGEEIRAIARVRTMPRALSRLLSHVEERLDGQQRPLHMAVMHADAPAAADDLTDAIRRRFDPDELVVTEFTSVMGAHTGPGFVGVAFFSGEPPGRDPDAVSVEPAQASHSGLEEDIRKLESSLSDVPPPASGGPALVLVSGLPGSGKSYFSRELTKHYRLAHLNSDVLRKALFHRPTHGAAESTRLFAAVHALVERLLSRGVGVVLDATNLKEEHRRPLYDIADRAGAVLVIVQTEAPPEVARRRLESRARGQDSEDASEATVAVYDRMRREAEPIERPHIRVDMSKDLKPALQEVLRRLSSVSNRLAR